MILKKLGTNIKIARQRLKLSQEELSFASTLDRSYIGGVERSERNISIINLCKIASALQTTPSLLLEGFLITKKTDFQSIVKCKTLSEME